MTKTLDAASTEQPVKKPARITELLLLLVAVAIGSGAYMLAGLGMDQPLEMNYWIQLGVMAALALAFHIVVRLRAPWAERELPQVRHDLRRQHVGAQRFGNQPDEIGRPGMIIRNDRRQRVIQPPLLHVSILPYHFDTQRFGQTTHTGVDEERHFLSGGNRRMPIDDAAETERPRPSASASRPAATASTGAPPPADKPAARSPPRPPARQP